MRAFDTRADVNYFENVFLLSTKNEPRSFCESRGEDERAGNGISYIVVLSGWM
jgi:hypothetical protein